MHRETELRGASSPPEVLTEDDDEPEDESHDGKDQPPVADGLIVWGGGEPSSVSPARVGGRPRSAEPTGRRGRGLPVPLPAVPRLHGARTHRS